MYVNTLNVSGLFVFFSFNGFLITNRGFHSSYKLRMDFFLNFYTHLRAPGDISNSSKRSQHKERSHKV